MNKDGLEKRSEIWEAISMFYLDTELDENDFRRIAHVFINSDMSLNDLKEIDLYEVFPILQYNLMSIAGEWGGFDKKWLHEKCKSNYLKRNRKFRRKFIWFLNLLFFWMRERYWDKTEAILKRSN